MPTRVLVIISEPEKPNPGDLSAFAKLYKLTASETRILNYLMQQNDTKEIAETLHINMTTLRSHLSALFAKTNTKNQHGLIKFCLSHHLSIN